MATGNNGGNNNNKRENNILLTATTLAKFIQYKNAALPASPSPTKVQSPQTVCVFCSFRFAKIK